MRPKRRKVQSKSASLQSSIVRRTENGSVIGSNNDETDESETLNEEEEESINNNDTVDASINNEGDDNNMDIDSDDGSNMEHRTHSSSSSESTNFNILPTSIEAATTIPSYNNTIYRQCKTNTIIISTNE